MDVDRRAAAPAAGLSAEKIERVGDAVKAARFYAENEEKGAGRF